MKKVWHKPTLIYLETSSTKGIDGVGEDGQSMDS